MDPLLNNLEEADHARVREIYESKAGDPRDLFDLAREWKARHVISQKPADGGDAGS